MRIAVCTAQGQPDDMLTWSGVPANIIRTLADLDRDHVVLDELAPLLVPAAMTVAAASQRARRKVNWEVEPWLNRRLTRRAQAQARKAEADVLLALAWRPLGVEDGDIPAVVWTDATFAQRVGKAPHWRHLSGRTQRRCGPVEGQSLREAAAVIMSSTYAHDDAISRYGLEPDRVHRIPFGSNVSAPGAGPRSRIGNPPRLLAVGVDWHRKGLDRCIHIADELHRRGVPVRLDVVGCPPPDGSWRRDYVTYHGFLDKRNTRDAERLTGLYAAADLFVLPTRNEPFGVAFVEAAAHALPALGSHVDGVPDAVADGRSGLLFPVDMPAARYADRIAELIALPGAYHALSTGALEHHRTSVNWESSVRRAVDVCATAARRRPVPS